MYLVQISDEDENDSCIVLAVHKLRSCDSYAFPLCVIVTIVYKCVTVGVVKCTEIGSSVLLTVKIYAISSYFPKSYNMYSFKPKINKFDLTSLPSSLSLLLL